VGKFYRDFTLMTECTPESSGCNSVYSVVTPTNIKQDICLASSLDLVPVRKKRVVAPSHPDSGTGRRPEYRYEEN
jgi:hypothetical protein